jgi:hypothetical protein
VAILFDNDKAYLHIPKTGGMWVRNLLEANGIDYTISSPPDYGGTIDAELVAPNEKHHLAALPDGMPAKNVFCTIRSPVSWYESYWLFRNYSEKWSWDDKRVIDSLLSKNARYKFQIFIDEMMTLYPNGYLGELYKRYTRLAGHYVKIQSAPGIIEKLTGERLEVIPGPINTRRAGIERNSRTVGLIREWEAEAERMVENCA